jgi:hypothetical protein
MVLFKRQQLLVGVLGLSLLLLACAEQVRVSDNNVLAPSVELVSY